MNKYILQRNIKVNIRNDAFEGLSNVIIHIINYTKLAW